MTTDTPCRLIVDPPADGAWNMAVDEALLIAATESALPTLRFYQWQRPTLSLGYFQSYADRNQHEASLKADVVRRLSGGGAILHDREVTYSLILPASHPLADEPLALYRAVHKAIVRLLSRVVATASSPWQLTFCNRPPPSESDVEPFLCFERRSPGDVLLQPTDAADTARHHKIAGSAQRRRRGSVLQHGSVLLGRSPLAPGLLGFNDVAETDLDAETICTRLPAEIAGELRLDLQQVSSTDMHTAAEALVESRYASKTWSKRR